MDKNQKLELSGPALIAVFSQTLKGREHLYDKPSYSPDVSWDLIGKVITAEKIKIEPSGLADNSKKWFATKYSDKGCYVTTHGSTPEEAVIRCFIECYGKKPN